MKNVRRLLNICVVGFMLSTLIITLIVHDSPKENDIYPFGKGEYWKFTVNDQTYLEQLPTKIDNSNYQPYKLTKTITKEDLKYDYFLVYTIQSQLIVKDNDRVLYRFEIPKEEKFKLNAPNLYHFVPLHGCKVGDTLEVKIIPSDSCFSRSVHEMYSGEERKLAIYILKQSVTTLIIAILLMAMSFAILIYCAISKMATKKDKKKLCRFAYILICVAVWCALSSSAKQYLIRNYFFFKLCIGSGFLFNSCVYVRFFSDV